MKDDLWSRKETVIRGKHRNAPDVEIIRIGTFSRIDHILGHKSNLGKFKTIEIISSIFSNHNAMRLDIKYRKKT